MTEPIEPPAPDAPTQGPPAHEAVNSFVDAAADMIELPEEMRVALRKPSREIAVGQGLIQAQASANRELFKPSNKSPLPESRNSCSNRASTLSKSVVTQRRS